MSSARPFLSIAMLAATLLYLRVFAATETVPIRKPLAGLPAAIGPWRQVDDARLGDDVFEILRPTDYLVRDYADAEGHVVGLYVGYWETQRKGAQLHSPKNCLPGGGWEPLEADRVPIAVSTRVGALEVNRYVLQKGANQLLVLYWFESQGRPVTSEVAAKIELVRGSLLRHRSDGAIVRVSSGVRGTVEETTTLLAKYVQAMYPMLNGFLPG